MSGAKLDHDVELATQVILHLLQRNTGDLVRAFVLVGSSAYGDFRAGHSDLDFVAILSRPLTNADVEGLLVVHRAYRADHTLPVLDGMWITEADLHAGPDAVADGPTSHDNEFVATARGNRNPVTWFELRRGVSVIGTVDTDVLWHDTGRLKAWVRENAHTYWRSWHRRASQSFTPAGLAMLGRAAPMWGVLGISRQCYTMATGEVMSKTGAGEWALSAFDPKWRAIIEEAIAYRRGSPSTYRSPFDRRRDALDFVATAIEQIVGP
jgi:hypothetical protein